MAPRSLRKGYQSIYLQYQHDGDSIHATNAETEVIDGTCIVRFTLKPAGENQRLDEEQLHDRQPHSIHITDEQTIERLAGYCKARSGEITKGMRLDISSKKKTLSFIVKPVRDDNGLTFQVLSAVR
jgi:hypothetical protein